MHPLHRKIRNKLLSTVVSNYSELNYSLIAFRKKNMQAALPSRPQKFEDKIEIIIPCYNHAKFLEQCFETIEHQSWGQSRVTVTFIDDNSTDTTPIVISNIISKHRRSTRLKLNHLHNSYNLRQHGSINRVVSESQNELFIILNDDDGLTPDCLAVVVRTLKEHPSLFMMGGSSLWFDKTMPTYSPKQFRSLTLTTYAPQDIGRIRGLNDINMTHSSTAFFRSAWRLVGGYYPKDKRLTSETNEDRDFQLRVAALLPVGVYKDYPLAFWRTTSSHGKDF